MANATVDPKNVTIRGRVSFPSWTHAEAVAKASKSTIPQIAQKAVNDPGSITPEFTLLVEQAQLDKLIQHLENEFIPYVEAQFAAKEKRDALDPKYVKKIVDRLASGEWNDGVPHLPIKVINEKTADLAPECVAGIKVIGPKGGDIVLEATVFSEDQLSTPDADILKYPVRKPIHETNFVPYPGAYFAATLNLYAYFGSSSVYGIGAGANIAFYLGNYEGERFGGGGAVNEDEIFAD